MTLPSSTPFDHQLADARKQFSSGQFDRAVELIGSVAERCAGRPQTLLDCARSFGHCYEIQRAEELLEGILASGAVALFPAVAMAFQRLFRPERAVAVLESLREKDQISLPSLAQLAKLYEQSNRQVEAIDALNVCVEQAPQQPQPKVLLARVHRQLGNLSEAEQLLEGVVSAPSPPATLVHGWSELTLLRDHLGEYEKAVEAIESAKSLLRQLPDVQAKARRSKDINAAFQRLYDQLDPTTLASWANESIDLPDVAGVAHLIGFPRSGTTLLEQMLDAHPEIHAASERAIFTRAIFPEMCRAGGLSAAALGNCSAKLIDLRRRYVDWHAAVSGQSLSALHVIDKNPNHTSLVAGLFRLVPEATFVFALRDPRDVIVSTYMRFFSLSEFSASYLTWESTCELYAHEMNIWLKMRGMLPEKWIETRYEETVDNPDEACRRVLELLGLPWQDMSNYRKGSHTFVHSPTHAEVRKPVYTSSVGRWRHYEPYLAPHLDKLTPFVKAFGYE